MTSPQQSAVREDSDLQVSDKPTSGRYTLLYRFVLREFLQNFAVAFSFFFCIFFINSILLLVQRILLKNIDMLTMLEMVALSMPQFLIYTFPFASLSASSMVLGDLGSTNELLAMRSSGIPSSKVYQPLIIISLLLFFQNLETLLFIGSQEAGAAAPVPFRPLVLALLWYMMIIVFHYALKKNIPENRFDSDARKNRAEAEYLMKVEMRMAKRRRKAKGRQLGNSTGVPSVPEYRSPEID